MGKGAGGWQSSSESVRKLLGRPGRRHPSAWDSDICSAETTSSQVLYFHHRTHLIGFMFSPKRGSLLTFTRLEMEGLGRPRSGAASSDCA